MIVLAGHSSTIEPPDDDTIRTALKSHLDAGATRRDAAAAVASQLGVPKRTAYALATAMRGAGTLTATNSENNETIDRATHTEGSR